MRDYGKVSPQFWTGCTGRKIRACGPHAQIVALYLVTCPSASMIGLYYLPLPTLAHETGIPLEGASKALRCLSEAGFAEYDEANEVVWVCEMARHQIGETVEKRDKRQLGIIREAQKVTYSRLFARWFARYQKPYGLPAMASTASPSEAPSKPLGSQEQEQEQEHEQDPPSGVRGSDDPTPPPGDPPSGDRPTTDAAKTREAPTTKGASAKPTKPKRAKVAPTPDTIPAPGTLARRVFEAIVGDRGLCAIVVNPGDAAERWADPATYPGVDVLAEVKRAGEWMVTARKPATDGRAFLRGWLQRKADEIARAPRVAGVIPLRRNDDLPPPPPPLPVNDAPPLTPEQMRALRPKAFANRDFDRPARRLLDEG